MKPKSQSGTRFKHRDFIKDLLQGIRKKCRRSVGCTQQQKQQYKELKGYSSDRDSFESTIVQYIDPTKGAVRTARSPNTIRISIDDTTPLLGPRLHSFDFTELLNLKPNSPDELVIDALEILTPAFPFPESSPDQKGLLRRIINLSSSSSNNLLIRQKALQLILIQIKSGHTMFLTDVISNYAISDASGLLSDLMASLPDYWMDAVRADVHLSLQPLWYSPSKNCHKGVKRAHAVMPYMQFLLQLVRSGKAAARIVFDAGVIDMLVRMCNTRFPDSRMLDANTSQWVATASLLALCGTTLEALACYSDIRTMLENRWATLAQCWPKNHSRILLGLKPMSSHFEDLVITRATSIRYLNNLSQSATREEDAIRDACFNLLLFSKRAHYDEDIVDTAVTLLLTHLSSEYREGVRFHLRSQILESPYTIAVDLFFNFTSRLLRSSISLLPVSVEKLPIHHRRQVMEHFFTFLQFMEEDSFIMKSVLEEAGVISTGYPRNSRTRATPILSGRRQLTLSQLDKEHKGATVTSQDTYSCSEIALIDLD